MDPPGIYFDVRNEVGESMVLLGKQKARLWNKVFNLWAWHFGKMPNINEWGKEVGDRSKGNRAALKTMGHQIPKTHLILDI